LRRPFIPAAPYQPFDRAKQFIQASPGFFLGTPQRGVDALFLSRNLVPRRHFRCQVQGRL
jgi:hypothetical protein